MLKQIKKIYNLTRQIRVIKNSNLFDEQYYLSSNPDIAAQKIDPIKHYLTYGWRELRNPSLCFDTSYYLSNNADVKESGVNPLLHYIQLGKKQQRTIKKVSDYEIRPGEMLDYAIAITKIKSSKLFDENYYLSIYPDVAGQNVNPIEHYLEFGWRELRNPSMEFDTNYYLNNHGDVRRSGINPLLHYIMYGQKEKRKISGIEKNKVEITNYIDDSAAVSNRVELEKYEKFRAACGGDLEGFFEKYDFDKYLDIYNDVKTAGVDPVIHYFNSGIKEGRKLFLKVETLNSLSNLKLSSIDYLDYKKRVNKATSVIYFLNLDPNALIVNPSQINKECDYVYFGVKGREVANSVWEYREASFYIDSLELMQAYYCLNVDLILPEYSNKVWLSDIRYATESTYLAIEYYLNNVSKDLIVFGSYGKDVNLIIDESILFDGSFYQEKNSKTYLPNCLIFSEKSCFNFLSKYWKYTLKYGLNFFLPDSIFSKVSYDVVIEDKFIRNETFNISDYKQHLLEYKNNLARIKLPVSEFVDSYKSINVSVVIPVYNALDDVKKCLLSLDSTTYENLEIIVADDGSEQVVKDWLNDYSSQRKNVVVSSSEVNQGYTRNVNSAIELTESDYVILLNSDTIVYGNWIEKLIIPSLIDNKVGIVGALSNAGGWQSVPYIRGKDNKVPEHLGLAQINEHLENNSTYPVYPTSDIINGFCICIKREVINKIGLFDGDRFPKGYGEEDDFCMRATLEGFKNVISTSVYVHHSKSKSFGHSKRVELATQGRVILDDKYGKESYKLLTESIGLNPLLESNRGFVENFYKNYDERKTILNERVMLIDTQNQTIVSDSKKVCVHIHLHFQSMLDYFSHYLANIPYPFDLYISVNSSFSSEDIKQKLVSIKNLLNVSVKNYENRGRDVFPFIDMVAPVYSNYDYILHLHSKKSSHNPIFGNKWLNHLVSGLLYNDVYIQNLLCAMDYSDVGVVYPPVMTELYPNYKWGDNKQLCKEYLRNIGVSEDKLRLDNLEFSAGNMFWMKAACFKKMFENPVAIEDFPKEPIPIDGTLAHAIERSLVFIAQDSGYNHSAVEPLNSINFLNEKQMFKERMLNIEEIEQKILSSIENKTPYSLVRFYDGEGAFYKAENWSNDFLIDRMTYYFGAGEYTKDDAIAIRDGMLQSLYSANLVGIPNLDIVDKIQDFMFAFTQGEIDKLPYIRKRYSDTIDCNSAWRILSSFEMVITSLVFESSYTTKDIHYDMVKSGVIYKILGSLSQVNIISSMEVGPYLEKVFNLQANEIKIPKRALDVDLTKGTNHFPNVFNKVLNELGTRDLTGEVFLVGAGPLGKIYCNVIKENGGIALDLGAIFDSWVNFHTRPEHRNENQKFDKDLLLTSENIEKLTSGKITPKSNLSEHELPEKKVNKYI